MGELILAALMLVAAGLAKNLMYQREHVKAIAQFEEALKIFEELRAGFYIATVGGVLARVICRRDSQGA
jgi:hypothetical protein